MKLNLVTVAVAVLLSAGNEMKRYFFSVVSEGGDTKAVGYIDMA